MKRLILIFAALAFALSIAPACEEKKDDKAEESEEGGGGGDEGGGDEGGGESPGASIEADREVDGLSGEVKMKQWIERGETKLYYKIIVTGEDPKSSVAFGYLDPQLPDGAEFEESPLVPVTSKMDLRNREFPGTSRKGITLDYNIKGLSKDTKKLSTLGGTLIMHIPGETETVLIDAPLDKIGKLDHPKLKEAGIEATLEKVEKKDKVSLKVAQTGGELGALEDVSLYVAEGDEARTSASTDTMKKLPVFTVRSLDEDKPLESLKLGLKINRDLEVVRGTFEMKDVPTP